MDNYKNELKDILIGVLNKKHIKLVPIDISKIYDINDTERPANGFYSNKNILPFNKFHKIKYDFAHFSIGLDGGFGILFDVSIDNRLNSLQVIRTKETYVKSQSSTENFNTIKRQAEDICKVSNFELIEPKEGEPKESVFICKYKYFIQMKTNIHIIHAELDKNEYEYFLDIYKNRKNKLITDEIDSIKTKLKRNRLDLE